MRNRFAARGFSLVEVAVVMVIIGILSVFTRSLYLNYVARSKVTEALKVLEEYKTIAESLRAKNDAIAPYYVLFTDADTTGFVSGTPSGTQAVKSVNLKYVSTIVAKSGTTSGNKYILIGAGLVDDNILVSGADHVYLAGIENSQGVFTWQCGSSTSRADNIPNDYLPKSCLNTLP